MKKLRNTAKGYEYHNIKKDTHPNKHERSNATHGGAYNIDVVESFDPWILGKFMVHFSEVEVAVEVSQYYILYIHLYYS